MKLVKLLLSIIGIAALAAMPAFAQSMGVIGDVPFSFQAGDTHFTAGEYVIKADTGSAILWVQNRDTRKTLLIMTTAPRQGETVKTAELRFRVYGNKHYLASVWSPTRQYGLELGRSRAEREAAEAGLPYKVAVLKVRVQ